MKSSQALPCVINDICTISVITVSIYNQSQMMQDICIILYYALNSHFISFIITNKDIQVTPQFLYLFFSFLATLRS